MRKVHSSEDDRRCCQAPGSRLRGSAKSQKIARWLRQARNLPPLCGGFGRNIRHKATRWCLCGNPVFSCGALVRKFLSGFPPFFFLRFSFWVSSVFLSRSCEIDLMVFSSGTFLPLRTAGFTERSRWMLEPARYCSNASAIGEFETQQKKKKNKAPQRKIISPFVTFPPSTLRHPTRHLSHCLSQRFVGSHFFLKVARLKFCA